jgi:hypothetical protein
MPIEFRRPAITACCLLIGGVALPPSSAAPPASTPLTREELIRKWDLNSDGSIDESEAEVARSRMRRERVELRMKTGIDPLTGRPRGEQTEAKDRPDAEREPDPLEMPAAEPSRPKGKAEAALPGTRAPELNLPVPAVRRPVPGVPSASARDGGEDSARAAETKPGRAGVPEPAGPARTGARQSADPAADGRGGGTGIVTGGARAGSPARPGYGSGMPKRDLNAGRLPGGLPGARSMGTRPPSGGGLLPTVRPTPQQQPRPQRTVDDFNPY